VPTGGARAAAAGDRIPTLRFTRAERQTRGWIAQRLGDRRICGGKERRNRILLGRGKGRQVAGIGGGPSASAVAVIATLSSTAAAVAAKAATSTIPIYFLVADPPDKLGLVSSLNRPGGNATGITTLAVEVAAKRLSLLRELVPKAISIALLLKPSHPSAKPVTASLQAAARTLGVELDVVEASTDREIEEAYLALRPGDGLVVATDPFFFIRRTQLVALSARHGVPTIYDSREFGEAGGLMSYGPNHVRLWEQAGTYIGRILKGEKPADLPVTQAAIFEMVINLKAAKALGLAVPDKLIALADEVIE
jgi:ABC-type uncharacterized transport system substrate-binding protein